MNDDFKNSLKHKNRILVVDFGSQYTRLIAKKLRKLGAFSEVILPGTPLKSFVKKNIKGIVISGGPSSVSEYDEKARDGHLEYIQAIIDYSVPILGICFGMQAISALLGGRVESSDKAEYGATKIAIVGKCMLFDGISTNDAEEDSFNVWMSHADSVKTIPSGFDAIALTKSGHIAAMSSKTAKIYALQFHPEVTHSENGDEILMNFIRSVCELENSWQVLDMLNFISNDINRRLEDELVLLAVSGGVDSTVAAKLLKKLIGKRLKCVFIDNGLLRKHEVETVCSDFRDLGITIEVIDAGEIFINNLAGVSDPEKKRKIIGKTFIEVFEQFAIGSKLNLTWLAQGTIYSDVIESAVNEGSAQTIKSHHNVGGLPEKLNLKLLEPFRYLFKDEVRALGNHLDISDKIIERHPFPGPGLAVRILGEVLPSYLSILRDVDKILIEELIKQGCYDNISQAFAVLIPFKSVGVVGDNRRYGYVIALRCVESEDFMTANIARMPWELLEYIASRILNEVADVARVVYDISSKPPATIEWE